MKRKKEFYQITYIIKCKVKSEGRYIERSGCYQYVTLKRLKEEVAWLKDLYKTQPGWKLSFGPIFHCVEI